MIEPPPQAVDHKETARLDAFSDGIFAIAITLLALELKVPLDFFDHQGCAPARVVLRT